MAASFFYFQWTYTKFKSIDFDKNVFYGKNYIFTPLDDEYIIILYNSKSSNILDLSKKISNESNLKIIAVDFYQNTEKEIIDNVIPVSSGMNTLLQLANKFKIVKIPVFFKVKRESLFKFIQNSRILDIN